ncbi:MAG: HAMP domain-containing histidine kinase, partial [Bacteroidetes bacterium]|nr:HAMP domain-containing histidine kinase [Bacteroidota bacterium]
DLAETVKAFYAENEQMFRGSTIEIIAEEGVKYNCSINHSLFQTVLINIISNAIRYNVSQTPCVSITFSQTKNLTILSFKDNGIGFEQSQEKKIFKKFYQIERADWSNSGGTGLGLYMVEQVVKFHRGKILAKSEGLGKGSIFILSLPKGKL